MSAGDRDTLAALITEELLEVPYAHIDTVKPIAEAVADVLLESDWLQEQRAQAWDEGYFGCCEIDREEREAHDYATNLYRLGDTEQP